MIAHVPHLISLLHAIKKAWGDLQDLRGSVTPQVSGRASGDAWVGGGGGRGCGIAIGKKQGNIIHFLKSQVGLQCGHVFYRFGVEF